MADNQPDNTEKEEPSSSTDPNGHETEKPTGKTKKKPAWLDFKNRKTKWGWGIGAAVFVVLGSGITYAATRHRAAPTPTPTVAVTTPAPTPTPSQLPTMLDGVMTTPDLANRHPLAIMVENHPEARPQSGLTDADVVYEAVAEGGITRFMALFEEKLPSKVGPVRSAREHFVSWVEAYKPTSAYYAHFGGSVNALARVQSEGVLNLDGLTLGAPLFYRIPKAGIASEHTAYTDPSKLYTYASQKNFPSTSTFTPWQFKDDADIATRPDNQTITLPFSTAQYEVKYVYNKTQNNYARFLAGIAHKDANNGQQIAAKNVAVMYISYSDVEEGHKLVHVGQTNGTGKATVFEDGQEIDATWSKPTNNDMIVFKRADTGAEIQFNRGQTWIEALPAGNTAVVQTQ